MGASQPKEITLNINLNVDSNNTKNSLEKDNDDVAPPPVSSFLATAQAKDKDGKNIPCKLNINSNSTNNYEKISTNPSDTSDSNISNNNNIDNNIARNKGNKFTETKNLQENNFSIFNEDNAAEKNKINNNDREIDKNIDVNKKKDEDKNNNNVINNNDNNINNEKKNDKNNFLKEGVNEGTNFGEEEKKEEENENNETPVGENIDMNIPKNKYEKNNEILINNKTPISDNDNDGNIDMNQGSRFNQKKDDEEDNYKGLNFSDGDLSLSQSVFFSGDASLENSMQLIQKGYYPLFMKLNNYKPLLFHIKEDHKLTSLVRAYFQYCPETDEGMMKDIKLYHEKKLLDINTPIKLLKLEPFSIITNKLEDNNADKK